MNNSQTFLINLKKDFGRYICSQNVSSIFGSKVFVGYDCNKINDKGYLSNVEHKTKYTSSAKKSKELLINNFLKTSTKDYLIIFEDDVYIHVDLFNSEKRKCIFEQINSFLDTKKPKLLYFGISRHFISDNTSEKIIFKSFSENFEQNKIDLCSGAYGFAIHRDMLDIINMRINNETIKDMPFDLFCLSYISKMYPNESFVMNPHLVVPNIETSNIREKFSQDVVWKMLHTEKNLYVMPFLGYLYINTSKSDINCNKFELFDKSLRSLEPLIKIVYFDNEKPCLNVDNKNKETLLLFPKYVTIDLIKIYPLKYFSAKTIIELIQNNNLYDYVQIVDKQDENIMNITYFHCYENFPSEVQKNIVMCDI